jgi:hypothetical protein
VANSVGAAELWVLLLFVSAVGLYLHGRRAGAVTRRRWVAIGSLYGLACFFKEHAIVLPAVLILAELLVVADRLPVRQRLATLRPAVLGLTVVAVTFLWARSAAVAGVSGFIPALPFQTLNLTTGNRILTMVGAVPEWFRLMLWPQRLMSDYTPPYIDIAEGPSLLQVPGALLLLGTLGLAVASWRRSPTTSFGILWIAVTLLPVSNLFVPTGILLAERTLMLPSVGAMIAVCSAIPWLYAHMERGRAGRLAGAAAVAVLLGLGITRSVQRNRVWLSNETLLRQGVVDAPRSYRTHWLLGNYLRETGRGDEGVRHLETAFKLFPYDPILAYVIAEELRLRGNCESAVPLYRWAFELASSLRYRQLTLAICLLHLQRMEDAMAAALDALRHGAPYDEAVEVIRAIDARLDGLPGGRSGGDSAVLAAQPG